MHSAHSIYTHIHTYIHTYIPQAVAQRYLQGTVEIQGGRAVLIEYFRQKGFADQRACFELPYQYYLAGQMAELENALKVCIPSFICIVYVLVLECVYICMISRPYQYHLAGQMAELENAPKVCMSPFICM